MADLVDWYNEAEQEGKLTPVELAALFHYRYIRIHPFEDGNGRIARLMVNFILARHNYPMIVVRSRKKNEYLEALHQTDMEAGPVPSDGAHADIKSIRPFLKYFNDLIATEVYNDVLFLTEKNKLSQYDKNSPPNTNSRAGLNSIAEPIFSGCIRYVESDHRASRRCS